LGLLDETADVTDFDDVSASDWYYRYVASARKLGIANGAGDGTFGAGKNILRQDMIVLAYRTVQSAGGQITETVEARYFEDQTEISDYAQEAVGALQKAGIISGNHENMFTPMHESTRAEAAKIVYMLLELRNGGGM